MVTELGWRSDTRKDVSGLLQNLWVVFEALAAGTDQDGGLGDRERDRLGLRLRMHNLNVPASGHLSASISVIMPRVNGQ